MSRQPCENLAGEAHSAVDRADTPTREAATYDGGCSAYCFLKTPAEQGEIERDGLLPIALLQQQDLLLVPYLCVWSLDGQTTVPSSLSPFSYRVIKNVQLG